MTGVSHMLQLSSSLQYPCRARGSQQPALRAGSHDLFHRLPSSPDPIASTSYRRPEKPLDEALGREVSPVPACSKEL